MTTIEQERKDWRRTLTAGVLQTVQLSRAPVIASHSGVRGRVNATRNLTNDELRAITARGGGVTGYAHVGEGPNVTRELLKRGYSEEDIRSRSRAVELTKTL
jgi:microsomal dipeptidase-like Zn-dependent dipeptidase